MRTYLFDGQSNNLSGDTAGGFSIHSLVTTWNNQVDRDDLVNLGTAWVTPDKSQPPFYANRNHFGVHACSRIARATGENIRMVKTGKGGQPISSWVVGGAPTSLLLRNFAILDAAGVSQFDALIWAQGEANEGTSDHTSYTNKFEIMINAYRERGYMTATTPIIILECAIGYDNANAILTEVASVDFVYRTLVPCKRMLTNDGTHWNGYELVRIGYMVAGAIMMMPQQY